MITIIIQDQQGTEIDRFQMIHAEFEDREKFPKSDDLFACYTEKELIDAMGNSAFGRMIRAAYLQGRACGGIGVKASPSGLERIKARRDSMRELHPEWTSIVDAVVHDEDLHEVNALIAPQFTVGAAVVVTKDNGDEFETRVRQAPWKTGSGHWLVSVDGIAGGYSLQRVRLKS